ncbi:hypothetical protein PROVRETT_08886 [Providencia rettgeri DSM 1131]|nr:hypothetical protein PROVRETT_08886 [Providencia rettgeri DSM 1131]
MVVIKIIIIYLQLAEDNCLSIFWGEIIRSFWSIGLLLNK